MSFDSAGRFIVENYPAQKAFSSFLPGIAGLMGIPMWVFYANRGQAIAGFGVESKDSPIMEFQPANKAYQTTAYTDFRTFLRVDGGYYEPFSPLSRPAVEDRKMFIGMNELEIQDREARMGLQTSVIYFTLTDEPFAGLVRQLRLMNESDKPLELEVLDGMAAIVPYGMSDGVMKMMSRTGEAWLEVFNLEHDVPFYRTRASIVDKSEVEGVEAGQFYLAFRQDGDFVQRLRPIVDPALIFGSNTALSYPDPFISEGLAGLLQRQQVTVGKTPCGFFGTALTLQPGESFTLYSIIGHVHHVDMLNREIGRMSNAAFISQQHEASRALARSRSHPG